MKNVRVFLLAPAVAALALVGLLVFTQSVAVGWSRADPTVRTEGFNAAALSDSWSSGWVVVPKDTCSTFNHNLGYPPEEYAVELWFGDINDGWGINRRFYGGAERFGKTYGAYWKDLTSNTIDVCRNKDDNAADGLRVRVWHTGAAPDYSSGWTPILPGETLVFTHGLGITATDLTVGLWFKGPVTWGIHNAGYGGMAIGSQLTGAHWHHLTDDTVSVTRYADDIIIEQVLVVVVQGAPPDYDSFVDVGGWANVAKGSSRTFTHDLMSMPELLLVRGECYETSLPLGGIHQWLAGTNFDPVYGWQGAAIQNLRRNTVQVIREVDDDVCPTVRIRIWRRQGFRIYLPVVVRNY